MAHLLSGSEACLRRRHDYPTELATSTSTSAWRCRSPRIPGFWTGLAKPDEYREHWLIQKLGPRILWVSSEHEPRLAVVCNQRDERLCRPVLFLGRIEDVQYVLHWTHAPLETHAPLKIRRLSGIFPRRRPLKYVLRLWLIGTLAIGPRSPCSHVASLMSSGESNSPALSMPARAPSGTRSRKA